MAAELERILEGSGRSLIEIISVHFHGVTEATKTFRQNIRCPSRDSSRVHPECESLVLAPDKSFQGLLLMIIIFKLQIKLTIFNSKSINSAE
jgi:hypothetical protein